MNKKLPIYIVAFIILAFAVVAVYTRQKAENIDFSTERQQAIDEALNRPSITINTKHQFKDGVHTFVGSIEVPTPCYTHNVEVKRGEEITELAITYIDSSKPDEMCAQVITEKTFKVTFEGTEDEDIIATINGEAVNLNVFEINPDEDIDDAEIFIKG